MTTVTISGLYGGFEAETSVANAVLSQSRNLPNYCCLDCNLSPKYRF
jgi:hypothetical protein